MITWNVGGLTPQKVAEVMRAVRDSAGTILKEVYDCSIVFLQEVTVDTGVITDYFQKKKEEEREEEGRSASSTTVAEAIASAPWRTLNSTTRPGGETASSSARPRPQAVTGGGAQPPKKKPRRTNPELEEARRIGDMLANPEPGQPQPTKEEMREDLGVLLALFQTALRRLEEDDQCREEDRRRGKQACFEAMEMLADLMDMVEEGIDKAHYRQLL